jgi:hypothetical protein
MASSTISTRCFIALALIALVMSFGTTPATARFTHDPTQSSTLASGGLGRKLKSDCQWTGVGE